MTSGVVRDERGSVLILALGLFVVVVSVLAVGVDVSVLQATRRSAQLTADAAARAGAQALDLASYYQASHSRTLPLDRAAAYRRVRTYVAEMSHDDGAWRLVDVTVSDDTVRVRVTRRVELPLSGLVHESTAMVGGEGEARLRALGEG